MVIYGTNGTHLRDEPLPGVPCPACEHDNSLKLSVYGRYAHVYWIPLVPYSRPTVLTCGHCQRGWDEKDLPADMRAPVAALKKETRSPWWHWSGLVLIAALISGVVVMGARHNRDKVSYLAAPHAGDIYTVRDSVGARNYSLLKVISAGGNAVELVANEYQIDNSHPIDDLNSPDKYSKESFSITLFDLQALENKGLLTDIERPDNPPAEALSTDEPTTENPADDNPTPASNPASGEL